mgnify:CR=1 FL=1
MKMSIMSKYNQQPVQTAKPRNFSAPRDREVDKSQIE